MIRETEIAVVGAGPAGAAAASVAARLGARVTLIDEQDEVGGHLRWTLDIQSGPPDSIEGKYGFEAARVAAQRVTHENIDLQLRSVTWGIFEERALGVVGPGGSYQLRADKVILATGSTDIVWPFRGWTLPGVLTARAARIFMHVHRVRPGRKVAIIGAGPDADRLAEDFNLAGLEVVARVDRPEEIEAGGEGEVEWVSVNGERTEADTVALALGTLADAELARQTMAEIEYSATTGCHVPVRSVSLETSVSGVYVIGDAGSFCTTPEAIAEGVLVAHAVTGNESGVEHAIEHLTRLRRENYGVASAQRDPAPIAEAIPDDVLVDREEQVTAAQVRQAIDEGAISINDVKRRTRAGMGVSQGRDTEYVIARMIHARTGIPLAGLLPMTARPPVRLISLADLADLAERTV